MTSVAKSLEFFLEIKQSVSVSYVLLDAQNTLIF